MISEKQLLNVISKHLSDDLDYKNVDNAEPESDNFVIGKEVGEQSDTTATDPASSEEVGSMGADEYPPYPEVPKWEDVVGSQLKRGHANPLKNTVWKSGIERGAANQISPQSA